MFIAMNRFRIAPGGEQDFESIWRNRQSYLEEVPGFIEFHLMRGRSENGQARAPEGTYLGPPQFEGFDVVL